MLFSDRPALILAPMQGVTDAPMRGLQGEMGAFTFAVSEFLRVSQEVAPRKMFLRHVPELLYGACTPHGLPVHVQLLGGDPERMALSALNAVRAGARSIDINFGCPAPTVNRNDGGATLLKYPHRIRAIVAAVRAALPVEVPVSAKLRLGWDTLDAIYENACMAVEGGANWITIHGRTRVAGYAPPIFWEPIGKVRQEVPVPVVANGDIWTLDDFKRCQDITGCIHYMLGRGALVNPALPFEVAQALGIGSAPAPSAPITLSGEAPNWPALLSKLVEWSIYYEMKNREAMMHRLKQWLKMAERFAGYPHFDRLKRFDRIEEFMSELDAIYRQEKVRAPSLERALVMVD